MVGTVCLTNFTAVVFFNPILGVFAPELEAEFGWSRASVAAAITIGSLTAAVLSPGMGWVVDRFGGRWVMSAAGLGMAIALAFLSGLHSLWQLYLFYAIGRGLAMSAVSNVGFIAVSNWFVRKRSMVIGFVAVAQRAGMATLPVFAAVVISAAGDWRAGWLALGAVALLFGVVPPALFVRRRPEDMGLRPDGDRAPSVEAGGDLPPPSAEFDFTLREAVATRAYWFMGIAIGLLLFTGGSVNFHQIPYLRDQGLGRNEAAFIVTVFSLVGAGGGLVGGFCATRVTARWTMTVSLVGMAAGSLLLLQTDTFSTALIFAVVYGSFFGSTVAMNQAIYADYFGRTSLGVIRGSFQPVQLALNAAGPLLTGLWVDWAGSYRVPFLAFGACLLAAALLLVLAPVPARPTRATEV
ncbi:MAG: MFS transporter [Chloroflexi bacterium]|nr:MFS transporter [Chloroflexota bacterium]MDA1145022.1 MFS transporter [Chloroflexota bacterium]MQC82907.1 MFS transporter [Chloroflexota bacterium]